MTKKKTNNQVSLLDARRMRTPPAATSQRFLTAGPLVFLGGQIYR
jgi:hypothetical protein